MGSVTRQVLSLAQRMTIFELGRETAFNPKCPISSLLLPEDGSEPSLEVVRRGAALAQSFKEGKPRLTLLYVIDFALLGTAWAEGIAPFIEEGGGILATRRRRASPESDRRGSGGGPLCPNPDGARGLSLLKQLILGSVSNDVLYCVSRSMVGIIYP